MNIDVYSCVCQRGEDNFMIEWLLCEQHEEAYFNCFNDEIQNVLLQSLENSLKVFSYTGEFSFGIKNKSPRSKPIIIYKTDYLK